MHLGYAAEAALGDGDEGNVAFKFGIRISCNGGGYGEGCAGYRRPPAVRLHELRRGNALHRHGHFCAVAKGQAEFRFRETHQEIPHEGNVDDGAVMKDKVHQAGLVVLCHALEKRLPVLSGNPYPGASVHGKIYCRCFITGTKFGTELYLRCNGVKAAGVVGIAGFVGEDFAVDGPDVSARFLVISNGYFRAVAGGTGVAFVAFVTLVSFVAFIALFTLGALLALLALGSLFSGIAFVALIALVSFVALLTLFALRALVSGFSLETVVKVYAAAVCEDNLESVIRSIDSGDYKAILKAVHYLLKAVYICIDPFELVLQRVHPGFQVTLAVFKIVHPFTELVNLLVAARCHEYTRARKRY